MTTPRRQFELRGRSHAARAGFTLVELLIVVTILIMVTVAAIPLLGPSSRGRQTREGARELSAFIAGARAKALALGRPVGIWLERFPSTKPPSTPAELQAVKALSETGGLHFCVNVYLAVSPPPYSGDTIDARVVVKNKQVVNFLPPAGWVGLVRRGDLIKLNYQGRLYQIDSTNPSDPAKVDQQTGKLLALPWTLTPVDFNTNSDVPDTPATGVPFQILRQPVRSNEAPLQLPGSAVIDLDLSGVDSISPGLLGGTFSAEHTPGSNPPSIDTNPVIITFGPAGAIDRVYYRGGLFFRPTEPVYLLVGRREKVYPGESKESSEENGVQFNFQDTGHWWVAIGNQTGRVTVTELANYANPDMLGNSGPAKTRHFARMAQSTGGR